MTPAPTGEVYILHFLDDNTRLNHVYMLTNKRQQTLLQTTKDLVAMVERRFGCTVATLRSDGEAGLGHLFDNWIAETGILHEKSPPYTAEQAWQSGLGRRSLTEHVFSACPPTYQRVSGPRSFKQQHISSIDHLQEH